MPPSNLPENFSVVIPIVAGIGNALMAVPMVRELKRHRPGVRIFVAARINAMGEPFRRLAEVDEVFITGGGARGNARGIRWMRGKTPDVFIVPFPSNRWQYNILAAASGAKRVLMHSYPVGGFSTLTHLSGATRIVAERGIHDVVQNLRLLKLLDIEPDFTQAPTFALTDTDRAAATRLLEQSGIDANAPFIAIHAGSAKTVLAAAKRWPPRLYGELIGAIARELPHQVLLLEGPDEAGVADEILSHAPGEKVLRLTGGLGDAAAVLARARLYAGSDSGLAHLAAAVGTRAVTLFAPADPDRVAPFGNRDLVVQPNCACAPCFLYPWEATRPKMKCAEPMCITQITVDQVIQAVRKGLS